MEVIRLNELVNIQSGYAFRSKEYTETGHFLIRISNVQDGWVSTDNPRYVQLDERTIPFQLYAGDFLTSLTGNIGRVAIVKEEHLPAALNQRVARITIQDKSRILCGYLKYFLGSKSFSQRLSEIGHGTAQKNVSPSAIGQLTIPLSPPNVASSPSSTRHLRRLTGR